MVEVGQTIYVTAKSYTKTEPNLKEYKVIKTSPFSFYAKKEGSRLLDRFDKKNMVSRFGNTRLKAYLTAEEYWSEVNQKKEENQLLLEIKNVLDTLDVNKLRLINHLIHQN